MNDTTSVLRRRVLGVVFFLVLALFLFVTIAMYNKAFKKVVEVDLLTDSIGNALPSNADVKVRGVLVGEVRSTSAEGDRVTSVLAIDPDKAELIPANATARLLPKTLFGERYVSLVIPDDPGRPLEAGDVLVQDTSAETVELGEVLDGVLPLLQAIPPQDLANTLGALAQGLSGRGETLGRTVEDLERIFREVGAELPTLQEDLRGLADFADTYSEAAPALVSALDNLRVTGNTIVEQQDQIRTLLASATAGAASTADLLQTNAESLITISADSKEALQLLARYSPSFPCMLRGFADAAPAAADVLAVDDPFPGVRANIQFTNPKGRYLPNQDEPRMLDTRGPACYDEVTAPGRMFPQYPGGSINDGSYQIPSRNPGPETIPYFPAPEGSGVPDDVSTIIGLTGPDTATTVSYVGSQLEQETLDVVYGQAMGIAPGDVPSWTTRIGAPAIRGTEVSFR
ncbi:MAG: MCE family protein [Rhodococcus sp.]|uniref:MCE family protein n=1 Tax=Rhodococcus TaxID=1827 RepID=UPI00169DE83F|nr:MULTISPECIES: MCE family protein [Rhodococcus]NLV78428.1 MCE family protein [Rhodococcus sp. (in: high G+C Gram-positive bacteria)]